MPKTSSAAVRILVVLTVAIGAMWAASLIVDMISPSYQPPDTIGLAFMAVLSTLLGMIAAAQRDGGKEPGPDETKD